MNYLGIKFPLPKPTQPVDKRELSVCVNGESARVYTLPGAALLSDEFIFAQGDSYKVTLVDVDIHGNRSQPSAALNGSLEDDIRPETPAAIGPIVPVNKRFLTQADADKAKADLAAKDEADRKARDTKAASDAKVDADLRAAHAKIDAEAAAKKAAVPAPK